MTSASENRQHNALVELHYALAEGDAEEPTERLRAQVIDAAIAARAPGRSSRPAPRLSGAEVFERTVDRLDALLGDLDPPDWSRPALRDLDVQGLVGHLIGIEGQFARTLEGGGSADDGSADHVSSTQPVALAQAGRPAAMTRREWHDTAMRTIDWVHDTPADTPMTFYGVTMPIDALLVVRAFEMWTHDEDVRRAAGRPLPALDAGRLARMAELAVQLLPAGLARANRSVEGRSARLVLTGPGGGTFDVALDGAPSPPASPADTRIVIDVTEFCRIVGDRPTGARPVISGDPSLADDVLVGAAALALD